MKKIYILIEARYAIGCAQSEAESLSSYAEAFSMRDAAIKAVRELADERIFEAFEGCDDRDARTDEAMADLFGPAKRSCDFTESETDTGWSWENADVAYVWRIIEDEVPA